MHEATERRRPDRSPAHESAANVADVATPARNTFGGAVKVRRAACDVTGMAGELSRLVAGHGLADQKGSGS
jgi:hypothetical protein